MYLTKYFRGKYVKTLAVSTVLVLSLLRLGAADIQLMINKNKELQLSGHVGNSYQFQSSTNLVDWITNGPVFSLTNVLYTRAVSDTKKCEFFKVRTLISATNNSYFSPCAEFDSVDIPLRGDVSSIKIIATHPTYQPTNYNSSEDFSNCPTNPPDTNYFTPFDGTVYDNGVDYVVVHTKATFWRPYGMQVTVNGANPHYNIHYLELGRNIPGTSEWPEFFVLYSDGNIRLIPFPPLGHPSVPYGSSFIVGPAPVAYRPFVDIASVDYQSSSRTLLITYRIGGTALLDLGTVTRTNSIVQVAVNYPTDQPFCTLRSMFVSDGNSDVDHVEWKDLSGTVYDDPIMSFQGTVGTEWFFNRLTPSKHNNAAPDIRITPVILLN